MQANDRYFRKKVSVSGILIIADEQWLISLDSNDSHNRRDVLRTLLNIKTKRFA